MFGFLPHNLFTNHLGQNTSGLSPRLWSKISGSVMAGDGQKRLVLAGDDFTVFTGLGGANPAADFPSVTGQNISGYQAYMDTTGSITPLSAATGGGIGGMVQFDTDTADNRSVSIGSACLGEISPASGTTNTGGSGNAMAFECRVRFPQVTTQSCFIGLAEQEMVADHGLVDNTGVPIAANACIGFSQRASGTVIDFSYQTGSGTRQDHVTDLCDTIVADQFYKLGFIFDPDEVPERRITVYVDNTEQSTYVTHAQMDSATFPDATEILAFVTHLKNTGGGSIDAQLEMDWWACASLID